MQDALNHFKKISEDRKKAVLLHRDGHQITIAKSALSPENRQVLESMSMASKDEDQEHQTIEHFDDGGIATVMPDQYAMPEQDTSLSAQGGDAPDMGNGKTGEILPSSSGMQFDPADKQMETENQGPGMQVQVKPGSTPEDEGRQYPKTTISKPDVKSPDYEPNLSIGTDWKKAASQQLGLSNAAAQIGATANGVLGTQGANILSNVLPTQEQEKNIPKLPDITDNYLKEKNRVSQELQSIQNEAKQNSTIDPQRFFHRLDTGQKISSAIGIMLSGLGSGLLRQQNPAIDIINRAVDNDIAAQKSNFANKNTLFASAQQEFGNNETATNFTKALMLDTVQTQLQREIMRSKNPLAVQEMKNQQAAIAGKQQEYTQRAIMMHMLQSAKTPGDYLDAMRLINPEKAKELEGRYVPGVGFSQIPMTNEDRDAISARQNINRMVNQILQFSHSLSPADKLDPEKINQGKAMAANLTAEVRKSEKLSGFRPAEVDFVNQLAPTDPTQFFDEFRSGQKYKILRQTNMEGLNTLLQSKGINIPSAVQQKPLVQVPVPKTPGIFATRKGK